MLSVETELLQEGQPLPCIFDPMGGAPGGSRASLLAMFHSMRSSATQADAISKRNCKVAAVPG